MHFNEYQKRARKTAMYPNKGKNYIYPALGLGGESGEVLEKIKKLIRDKGGKIDKEFLILIEKELGDILWYIANLAVEFKIPMDRIAIGNIKKLADRAKRNKLKGSGDLR
ncbi:MAG: nucleoside triphosphate pyrophosphohydrolase family protein [bacterium]|nr:nucleoside triphosphate pyrophosphohydrolase family protein [bacterium]